MNNFLLNLPFSVLSAISFTLAVLMSMIFVPVVSKIATVNSLLDSYGTIRNQEASRKIHTGAIPRLGGIAMVLAFLISISVLPPALPFQGVLVASLAVFMVGFIDDLTPLRATTKLIVQVSSAAFAIYHDNLFLNQIVITNDIVLSFPPIISLLVSTFIIVGAVNAINLIDGLDGLAAGIVLIGIGLLSFADYVTSQSASLLIIFSLPIAGALFGFLRYNTHPATIFMGDCGSNWLGFMSGALILLALKERPGVSPPPFISIILTFAIPIIDTATVMLKRIHKKTSPFTADKNHFHHTLIRIGLSHSQSVTTIYFLAFAIGVLGIFPAIFPKYNFPWVPYVAFLALTLLIPSTGKIGDNAILNALKQRESRPQSVWIANISWLIRALEYFNRYLLYLILILGPALTGKLPVEFKNWAAVAASILVLSSLIPHSKRGSVFFDSFAVSISSVVILIVNNINPLAVAWNGEKVLIHNLYNVLFIILFIGSLALFLVSAKRRSLIFTPSDFLLLSIPLFILLFPQSIKNEYKLDLISLRSLVIFMAMRVLYRRRPKHISHLKGACLAALVWVYLVAAHGIRILY